MTTPLGDAASSAAADAVVQRTARSGWNALVYFMCALFFNADIWHAVAFGVIVGVAFYVGYGARWIERFGFLAGAAVMLIWIGVLPPASEWRNAIIAAVQSALDTNRANPAFWGADDTRLLSH